LSLESRPDPVSEEAPSTRAASGPVIVITGGAGFLGQALVRELLAPRSPDIPSPSEIRLFDRRPAQTPDPRVRAIQGDLLDRAALLDAFQDADAVIHTASLVDYGHTSLDELHAVNVGGVENVVSACSEAGVRALVHTSTMDVVYAGRPVRDGDERTPYPERFADRYAQTKALGEQAALQANGRDRRVRPGEEAEDARLRACAVRPCGMYGEADPYHVSNVLRMAQAGKLTARMGNGTAVFQHVYVGNVAHGHLLALASLLSRAHTAAGEIYLLTDTPAINFFDFMQPIIEGLGQPFPPRSRSIPYPVAFALGAMIEWGARLLRPVIALHPVMTQSSVRIVCQDFSFSSRKAARELGYRPVYSEEESLARTIEWFRKHGPLPPP
jgi:nucleoside-diphosphate-sugar epimerase